MDIYSRKGLTKRSLIKKRKTGNTDETIKARRKKIKRENSATSAQNEKRFTGDEASGDLNS